MSFPPHQTHTSYFGYVCVRVGRIYGVCVRACKGQSSGAGSGGIGSLNPLWGREHALQR